MSPRRRLASALFVIGLALSAFPKNGLADWIVWPMWLLGFAALISALVLAFTMLGEGRTRS
jgi:hypothetical protein